ncbi:MAG: tRNA (adenosine(37)-N6)-dimethylallyltransferase MiaA [Candidatus Peribacteraceae bacterium]
MSHPLEQKWQLVLRDFLANVPVRPLLVLIGPTASGKTALSVQIARKLLGGKQPVEIVNADSRQLYRHLDIGTAKITETERSGVPHHLFSLQDPREPVSIAWYQKEAMRVIDDIHGRSALPLLVGGSMLYVSSIVDGLAPVASDPSKRAALEAEYDRDAGRTLHARLESLDPETAASIPVQNKVYVVRAMEMIEGTGKTKKEILEQKSSPYTSLILGIDPEDSVLRERIEKRIQAMFDVGWGEEVENLRRMGYTQDDPGMQSVGYRQILEAIENGADPRSTIPVITAKTWQYARRHRTWWRGDERVKWLDE